MKPPFIWSGKPQSWYFSALPSHPIHQQFLVVLAPKIFLNMLTSIYHYPIHFIISFLSNLLTGSSLCMHASLQSILYILSGRSLPNLEEAKEGFQEALQIQVCCSPAQNRIFSVFPLLMGEIQGLNPTCHLPSPASPVQPKGSIVLAGSNHSAYFSGPHPGKALVHVGAMHILTYLAFI